MDNRMALSLGKRQLEDSIWKSAHIEGLKTEFLTVENILNDMPVLTCKEEMLFVVNLAKAWEYIIHNVDYGLSLDLLCTLNELCLDNLDHECVKGAVRNFPVTIKGTTWTPDDYPNPSLIDIQLLEMTFGVYNAQRDIDKTDLILDIFCYVCRTQIFGDGNKRVAQLLTNKMLMQYDIGLLSIPIDKIDQFKRLLIDFYETNDSTKLKNFLRSCILFVSQYIVISGKRKY